MRRSPCVRGVSRVDDHEHAVLIALDRRPSDAELRQLHDLLSASADADLPRALDIADRAMFELLESEGVSTDEHRTVFGLTDGNGGEVASVDEASEALQEAVEWLQQRGYITVSKDGSGEYVDVLRRPGEDD